MIRTSPLARSLRPAFTMLTLAVAPVILSAPAKAGVERIEIIERKPFATGRTFGAIGAYELVKGRLHYSVLPDDAANAAIVDLDKAPRDDRGRVTFVADFALLKPADAAKGNGALLYEVNNRGNLFLFNQFHNAPLKNDIEATDAIGDGFLLEQGYSVLWSGWNWDVQAGGGRQQITLPVASDGGKPITGPVHHEFSVGAPARSASYVGILAQGYLPAEPAAPDAVLTVRDAPNGTHTVIPRDKWSFGKSDGDKLVNDPASITLVDGIQPGRLYELSFTSRDPKVVGLGLAAIRDTLSFFRYEAGDAAGTANPLAEGAGVPVKRVLAFGISQSGRVIQTLLLDGLNLDEQQRATFDGAFIHVAGAGKGGFNFRFAQTTRHFSPLEETSYPTDYFPFATTPETDPFTGRTASVLDRPRAAKAVPRLIYTNTSTDYWGRSASLLHTDPKGEKDGVPDPNVRIYALNGAQHVVATPPDRNIYDNCYSALDYRVSLRALLLALDRWVIDGTAPPESRYPTFAANQLVTFAEYRKVFPRIAGARLPGLYLTPHLLDAGPDFAATGVPAKAPPAFGPVYGTRLPAVDADGIDVGGIRQVEAQVPLGTYTGWNPRSEKAGNPEAIGRLFGSFIPFARTKAERTAVNDPRLSLEERYGSRDAYAAAAGKAAQSNVELGFLRAEDKTQAVRRAVAFYDRVQKHDPEDRSCTYLAD